MPKLLVRARLNFMIVCQVFAGLPPFKSSEGIAWGRMTVGGEPGPARIEQKGGRRPAPALRGSFAIQVLRRGVPARG